MRRYAEYYISSKKGKKKLLFYYYFLHVVAYKLFLALQIIFAIII